MVKINQKKINVNKLIITLVSIIIIVWVISLLNLKQYQTQEGDEIDEDIEKLVEDETNLITNPSGDGGGIFVDVGEISPSDTEDEIIDEEIFEDESERNIINQEQRTISKGEINDNFSGNIEGIGPTAMKVGGQMNSSENNIEDHTAMKEE